MPEIHLPGSCLYVLLDTKLNGYITWLEKDACAIMAWTTGEKAEEYATKMYADRPLSVCTVRKQLAKTFIKQMVRSNVDYLVLDVRPELVEPSVDGLDMMEQYLENDPHRHYAIMDLKKVVARLF